VTSVPSPWTSTGAGADTGSRLVVHHLQAPTDQADACCSLACAQAAQRELQRNVTRLRAAGPAPRAARRAPPRRGAQRPAVVRAAALAAGGHRRHRDRLTHTERPPPPGHTRPAHPTCNLGGADRRRPSLRSAGPAAVDVRCWLPGRDHHPADDPGVVGRPQASGRAHRRGRSPTRSISRTRTPSRTRIRSMRLRRSTTSLRRSASWQHVSPGHRGSRCSRRPRTHPRRSGRGRRARPLRRRS
jgi:hypothetical protein